MSSPAAPSAVLITGAGSGIGRQLALMLAAQGRPVAAVDLQTEPLKALEAELQARGQRCAAVAADVTDRAALFAAVRALEEHLGPTDLLIASAGIGVETSALDFDPAVFEKVVAVNLVGVANSVAAVLPGMLQRRRGHLVAMSSLASYRGVPHMAGYCASKAGVNALFDALRVELKPHGIATTTVCPGWIRTPMTANVRFPIPRMLDVADAAGRILRAIERRRPFVAFPANMRRRLGLLRWLPLGLSDWLMDREMRRLRPR